MEKVCLRGLWLSLTAILLLILIHPTASANLAIAIKCNWQNDEEPTLITLDQNPKFIVDENGFQIVGRNIDLYQSFEDLQGFQFVDDGNTSISDISKTSTSYQIVYRTILINFTQSDNRIAIIDLKGQILRNVEVPYAGQYSLPLEDLPTGVYIITINNNTPLKIVIHE